MRDKRLLIILFGLVQMKFFSMADPYFFFDPFPFYELMDENGKEVGISLQTYIQYMSYNVFFMCIWLYLGQTRPNEPCWRWFFWLELGELADFCLHYNEAFFNGGPYGVEYYDFKILGYTYIIWKQITS